MEKIIPHILLVLAVFSISACGGGGSKSPTTSNLPTSTPNSISSASSSYSPPLPPTELQLPNINEAFETDEDVKLTGELSPDLINMGFNVAPTISLPDFQLVYTSQNGGQLTFPGGHTFTYTPQEDFNGEDTFNYQIYRPTDGSYATRTVKVHVRPMVDKTPKLRALDRKFYKAGDHIKLAIFWPDTQEIIEPDSTTKILLDNTPLTYSHTDGALQIVLPAIESAGQKILTIEQKIAGSDFVKAQPILMAIEYQDTVFYLGNKNKAGEVVAMVRDNDFTELQTEKWINNNLPEAIQDPLVLQYADYWSLALLKKPAEQRLTLLTSNVLIPTTASPSAAELIATAIPNFTLPIVLSGLDGRSTGGYPVMLSAINGTDRTLLHELGHAHAKLGDEYAETGERLGTHSDFEGLPDNFYPNVSTHNIFEKLYWKHWIKDQTAIPGIHIQVDRMDTENVGAFLGAYHLADMYYRPTQISIMLDNNTDFGPVNKEAWVLANYAKLGILDSARIEKNGNTRTVQLARSWNTSITRIDWYIDGVKQEQWANKALFTINEAELNKSNYKLTAQLVDLTGNVLNPNAYGAFNTINGVTNPTFKKEWALSVSNATAINAREKIQGLVASSSSEIGNSHQWTSHIINVRNSLHSLTLTFDYEAQETISPLTRFSKYKAIISSNDGVYEWEEGIDIIQGDLPTNQAIPIALTEQYKIVHPKIKGGYKIAIYSVHDQQKVQEFTFP